MRKLPFAIDDTESDVFGRRTSAEVQKDRFVVARLFNDLVGWSFALVNQVGIEYVELVTLYDLRWRVVRTAQFCE